MSKKKKDKAITKKKNHKIKNGGDSISKERNFTFIDVGEDGKQVTFDVLESKLENKHHQAMADDLYFRFTDSSNQAKALFMLRVEMEMKKAEELVEEVFEKDVNNEEEINTTQQE